MTVAWGLLSTARINRAVIEAARQSDRAEVVAVASRTASRAEEYAREHRIEALHRAPATGTAVELEPVPSTTGSVR